MLLITYSCNLNCAYCYEPKTENKKMTPEKAISYIKDVVDNLDDSYSEFEVQFMGGEPLLQFDLIKTVSTWLWEQTFKIKLSHIFIVTNGTLLNANMKQWLSANRDRICIGLSFDGDNLMQNINRSSSASLVDVAFFASNWPEQTVKMTISPETIGRLYDGVKYLVGCGFSSISADLAMGNKIIWKDSHLTVFAEQLDKLVRYYVENVDVPLFSMFNVDVVSILTSKTGMAKNCSCGENLVCIDTDGQHYPCHLFSPITLTREELQGASDYNFRDHECFTIPACKDCAIELFCPQCYGMNYLCTGDIRKQSPFTCSSTKIQFVYACKCQMERAAKIGDAKKYSNLRSIIENIQL